MYFPSAEQQRGQHQDENKEEEEPKSGKDESDELHVESKQEETEGIKQFYYFLSRPVRGLIEIRSQHFLLRN